VPNLALSADSESLRLKSQFCSNSHVLHHIGQIQHYIDKRQTLAYTESMKYLNWSSEKNEILKARRGISFEEIAYLIESGQILGIAENPGRPNQKIYILEIESYAVIVPFVEKDNEIFLKTAFPSRKYTKRYGLKGE